MNTELDNILASVDLKKVYDEMLNSADVSQGGQLWAEAIELILEALNTWMVRDKKEFSNVKVETPYQNNSIVVDLEATCNGTMAPFKNYDNPKIILDWKTSMAPVDSQQWKDKMLRSWQWKKYASVVTDAKLFIYRGISRSIFEPRNNGKEIAERCREIIIVIPPNISVAVENQWAGANAVLKSLEPFNIWPQKTESCYSFGVECPEYPGCMSYSNPPKTVVYDRELSYSSMELLLRCPERFRMRELRRSGAVDLEEDPQNTDNTVVGKIFHAGIAEIYRQVFK